MEECPTFFEVKKGLRVLEMPSNLHLEAICGFALNRVDTFHAPFPICILLVAGQFVQGAIGQMITSVNGCFGLL